MQRNRPNQAEKFLCDLNYFLWLMPVNEVCIALCALSRAAFVFIS